MYHQALSPAGGCGRVDVARLEEFRDPYPSTPVSRCSAVEAGAGQAALELDQEALADLCSRGDHRPPARESPIRQVTDP